MIKNLAARIAAVGAVKRKGIAGLTSYGGSIEGKGEVLHKTGEKAGKKTKFVFQGHEAAKQ